MATRLPASQHTREELTALIEGRLSRASAKDELVKLATRLIVEEALEGEAGDALGREYYEHGAQPGQRTIPSRLRREVEDDRELAPGERAERGERSRKQERDRDGVHAPARAAMGEYVSRSCSRVACSRSATTASRRCISV